MFVWKEELELGIPSIDDQHKELLNIGNKINDIILYHSNSDKYDEIIDVITELKEYTVYHFKAEEEIFSKYNYPQLEEHKKEHDEFVEYLNSFDFYQIDENQEEFLKELLEKIVNWVFQHIITSDYLYKDYLISKGLQ